jgi:hypothetical protein
MRRTGTLLATTVLLGALAACNPTWTKEGKPSDASMPLPPDAKPPAQASTSQPPSR